MGKRKAADRGEAIRWRKGRGEKGDFPARCDLQTGKRGRRRTCVKAKADCAEKLRVAASAVDTKMYTKSSQMTLEQWLQLWLDEYCRDVKMRTMDKYRSTVRLYLVPALGTIRLSALSQIQVQHACNRFGGDGKSLSAKTVRDIHGVLHRALQQAAELELIARNPADHCRLPRVIRSEIQPMDKRQIAAFIEEIKMSRFGNVFMFDLLTGLRTGEMLALSWDCVDFEKGVLRIWRQLHQVKGGYVFGTLKNDKPRHVPIPECVLALLKKQHEQQQIWRLAAGMCWENAQGLVFTNETGSHLVPNTVRKELHRVTARMGLEGFRFHDLRHSYATLCLSEGVDIKTLQSNLGHHSPAFTMEQYGHCTDEMKKASAMRLDAFVQRISDL